MTTPSEVAAWYEARAVEHERHALDAGRRASMLSNARLGAFAALVLAVAWLATTPARTVPAVATVAALAAFIFLVVLHGRARAAWRHARSLGVLHRRGLARVRRDWAALDAAPSAPPPGHPYARDLDVLGEGASLLALLDVVSAWPGRPTLTAWLLAPAPDAETIRARQQAAAELAARVELRHELALSAADAGSVRADDVARFAQWASAPGWLTARRHVLWAARLLPIAFVALAVLALRGLVPWTIAVLPLVAAVLIVTTERPRLEASFGGAMLRATGLRRQRAMLALVQDAAFDAPLLRAIQQRMAAGGGAARQLRRLESVLALAEVRYSPMLHGPLQLLLLWDVHVVARLERWQRTAGAHVSDWLAALGEAEALAALGTLAFDNPDWCFPAIADAGTIVAGEAVGHPLLAPTVRVANDVRVGPAGTLLVVTGSNMSGKSTLLRSIGLDAVLALAGGPVCARRFTLPLLDLWTSARVDDSLAQGMSLFMAELKRLQAIVEAARDPARSRPMLYLLDEILHGTNTAERQIAARTILRHLLHSGAIGAVTTHDLTLAAEPSLADAAVFVHFTEQFTRTPESARMTFDYRLRPGLATSTNAIRLLELLGLAEGDRPPPPASRLPPPPPSMRPLQDLYPDDFSHCYGCGRLNAHGLHVKSEWHDGECVARFQPAPYHMALPGFTYGGLIASLADCHAMATAAGAAMAAAGARPGVDETPRFVTASLHVDFLRPTPLGPELLLRARAVEVGARKVVVEVSVVAEDAECAKARVVAVRAPATMIPGRRD